MSRSSTSKTRNVFLTACSDTHNPRNPRHTHRERTLNQLAALATKFSDPLGEYSDSWVVSLES